MKPLDKIFTKIVDHLAKLPQRVKLILTEGESSLIQKVADHLTQYNITPILLLPSGDDQKVSMTNPNVILKTIHDFDLESLANQLFQLRKNKITFSQAQALIKNRSYLATMLLKTHWADAVLGGINTPSSEVILPALQIIKAKHPNHLVSSVFLMQTKDQQNYIFTDCGLNVDPSSEQLSQIADLGYRAAVFFHLPSPQIAFLSYSTGYSGKGASVAKVRAAVAGLVSSKWNLCPFEGPIQFDAAMSITTRVKKLPNTKLAKIPTNILVFPDLDAGNIGYKIAQWAGGFTAVGPILFGLSQPMNDLSRGATYNDVLKTALVTAAQAQHS